MAHDWHALGAYSVGLEAFNVALRALTDRCTNTSVDPAFPTSAPLLFLGTGEATLDPVAAGEGPPANPEWCQFQLNATGDLLTMNGLDASPRNTADGTATLADFINRNETAIRAGKSVVPASFVFVVPANFAGAPFQAGSSFGESRNSGAKTNNFWNAPGILNNDARQKFSLGLPCVRLMGCAADW